MIYFRAERRREIAGWASAQPFQSLRTTTSPSLIVRLVNLHTAVSRLDKAAHGRPFDFLNGRRACRVDADDLQNWLIDVQPVKHD